MRFPVNLIACAQASECVSLQFAKQDDLWTGCVLAGSDVYTHLDVLFQHHQPVLKAELTHACLVLVC